MVNKSKNIKLTDAEIKSIEDLKKETAALHQNLGQLNRQKWKIEEAIAKLKNELVPKLEKDETELFKQINDKYGDGQLDLTSYEFKQNN